MLLNLRIIPRILGLLGFFTCLQVHAYEFNTGELLLKSGGTQSLDADEGYLLLSLEAGKKFKRVVFRSPDFIPNRFYFKDIGIGRNHAMVKLKAGKYYLEYFYDWDGPRVDFEEDEFNFEVKSGVVNYPGTLVLDYEKLHSYSYKVSASIQNRVAFEYPHFIADWLKLTGQAKFQYNGKYADDYLSQLTKLVDQSPFVKLLDMKVDLEHPKKTAVEIISDSNGLDAIEKVYPQLRSYLETNMHINGGLNDSGSHYLFATEIAGKTYLCVADTKNFEVTVLFNEQLKEEVSINELQWVDNRTIHYSRLENYTLDNFIAHLTQDTTGRITAVNHLNIPINGYVISPLESQSNELYFASYTRGNNGPKLQLFLLNTESKKSIKKSLRKPYKATKEIKDAINYVIDQSGNVRAATTLSVDDEGESMTYHYWFLDKVESGQWREIAAVKPNSQPLIIKALSDDESFFYVITDQFSDKAAIHKYSTTDFSHQGLLYEDKENEISELIFENGNGRLVGYKYFDEGVYKLHYFNTVDNPLKIHEKSVGQMQFYLSQFVKKTNQILAYGVSSTDKGGWYIKELEDDQWIKVFDINPKYDALPKGEFKLIKTQSSDGLTVEGFLVKPKSPADKKVPLVVIPHGGPIGVKDIAYDNSIQHFFASQGIATLKVNYRGSSGYGKAFQEKGNGEWGEKIEQDIHAVVLETIKSHNVDSKLICSMGASYGGYSAVMLTILYPEYYQCAVSWAGVMDLPLMFNNSIYTKEESAEQKMKEIIGDPIKEHSKLQNKSPVYFGYKLSKPMLLLQGMKDLKVHFEHALRMYQMSLLFGHDLKVLLFKQEGHQFSDVDSKIQHVGRSLNFIKQHLKLK